MQKKLLIAVLLVLFCLVPDKSTFPQKDDLEKEFFRGVAEMEREYRSFEKAAFEEFRRAVKSMWGDVIISTKKDWVEYSDDKSARSRVDFEIGEVRVEVLVTEEEARRDPRRLDKKIMKEIQNVVVNKGRNRDYNLPTPETVNPPSPLLPRPVLEGQLKDSQGRVATEENKEEFAREIIQTKSVVKEELETKKGKMIKAWVKFPLVPDHLRIRAQWYLDPVRKQAKRFGISVPVALAVMHTESYFNPKAMSPVPAYGLMQLVPRAGALDAYRYVYKVEKIVSADYLYDPVNNIELGCAYLGLLKNRYFQGIHLPENALYCSVASYNTGPGNLSRTLCGKKYLKCAVDRANTMTPEALFSHLRKHLPHQETRDYLKKVTERMRIYEEWA